MVSYKKMVLGLLLSSIVCARAAYIQEPLTLNGKYLGVAGLLGLAQLFRATPPAPTAPDSEKIMYRNGRVAIGLGCSAVLAATTNDPVTRGAIALTGIAAGEVVRVLRSPNPKAMVEFKEPLQYAAILAGVSWAMNEAAKAIIVRW